MELLRRHNESLLNELEEGDLVEFSRGYFSHWGVYVEGHIVHLTKGGISSAFSSNNCSTNENGCVRIDPFWSVVQDNKAQKNSQYDKSFKPLPKDEIKRRAKGKIGQYTYNFVVGNCEPFVSWCRNNTTLSQQAGTGLFWITVVWALGVVLGLGAAILGGSGNKKN